MIFYQEALHRPPVVDNQLAQRQGEGVPDPILVVVSKQAADGGSAGHITFSPFVNAY